MHETSQSDSVYSNDTSVHKGEEEEPLSAAGENYTSNRREPIVSTGEISDKGAKGRMAIGDGG